MRYRVAFVALVGMLVASVVQEALRTGSIWPGLAYGTLTGLVLDVLLGGAASVLAAIVRQRVLTREQAHSRR
jgi:hypothetical protein